MDSLIGATWQNRWYAVIYPVRFTDKLQLGQLIFVAIMMS